ncbi:MAG: radical SAM protein [Deltaproteobacteria bacterium]|nr:radical SAM protein [Deltaproteobacteria bacterium]
MRFSGLVSRRFAYRHRALLPRLAVNFARASFSREPVFRSLDIAVTAECPLTCAHCYSRRYAAGGRPELSAGEIAGLIGQADRMGAVMIQFNGGEPLTRSDLADLVAAVPRGRMCKSVTTSGLGLDAARLGALAAAGLDFLVLSIDHADAPAHDAARGRPGLFDNAVAMARLARSVGLGVMINTIAGEDAFSGDGAERVARLALGLDAELNLIAPAGSDGAGALSPGAEAKRRALLLRRGIRWCGDSNYLGGGCAAGREKLTVSPFGDVYACALVQVPAGSVRTEPLDAIWRRLCAAPVKPPGSCGNPRGGSR